MEWLMNFITGMPWLRPMLEVLGGLYVLGICYVAMTPTEKDNGMIAWFESHPVFGKLATLLLSSSPVERKKKD